MTGEVTGKKRGDRLDVVIEAILINGADIFHMAKALNVTMKESIRDSILLIGQSNELHWQRHRCCGTY